MGRSDNAELYRPRDRDAVPAAIAAGADMFLFCKNTEEDIKYMMEGYKKGIITAERLDEAVLRILGVKASLRLYEKKLIPIYENAVSVIGCEEHKKIEKTSNKVENYYRPTIQIIIQIS